MIIGSATSLEDFIQKNSFKYVDCTYIRTKEYLSSNCIGKHATPKFAYLSIWIKDYKDGIEFNLCISCAMEFLQNLLKSHSTVDRQAYRHLELQMNADAFKLLIHKGYNSLIQLPCPIITPRREFVCPLCKKGHMWESNPTEQDGKWYCASSECSYRMNLAKEAEEWYLQQHWDTLQDRMDTTIADTPHG